MQTTKITEKYDILILGGGCSGLQLSNQLIWKIKGGVVLKNYPKILILEARKTYTNDRTWSFWNDGSSGYCEWAANHWRQWSFSSSTDSMHFTHKSHQYEYFCLRGIDFYERSLSLIKDSPNISIKLGVEVNKINKGQDGFLVKTDSGLYSSKQIIDCRYKKPDKVKNATWQIFYGYEITFKSNLFQSASVKLMDDIRHDKSGIYFKYLLPLTDNSMLLQITYIGTKYFTPDHLKEEATLNANQILGRNWQIQRTEKGVLLQSGTYPREPIPGAIQGGSNWGALRPASGYAFSRIEIWSQETASRILKCHTITKWKIIQTTQDFMDRVFLMVLKKSPASIVQTLLNMGKSLHPNVFARFMGDKANLTDLFKVILTSPKKEMVLAALRIAILSCTKEKK